MFWGRWDKKSGSGAGGRRFDPRPRHAKGVENGTSNSLAGPCIKKG